MENVRTVYIDMPATIKGYTIAKDDFYTIVLNSNLSNEQNKLTYMHEMYHITNGDFQSKNSVGLIEIFAHKGGVKNGMS